ncbi:UDP-glucose 4-epimerase [Nitrosospira sp. Nl5]|uniref:UDP-glucose 4-epimerase family protein n=1 Tax=Nitrosospira sp. Nl5 TaxID=200120 RepID=UPI00088F35AD|nr:SDR family oxidoreductase [Nitrosospira sp. Nl5]SCY21349.1 UDP-glucose 4-epimerase [Nitrosospira sp. Nl5]
MASTLVTGASGFVGRALVAELLARGIHARGAVRGTVRLDPGVDQVVIEEVDSHTDWHEALAGVESVVHLAARVHVMHETISDTMAAFRAVNTEGTLNLARQAAKAGVCRFAFVSTIKVNGEGRNTPYTESDLPSPQDPYAISKWEAEQGLRDIAARTGMEVVILRPPLVYGPGVGGNFLRLMRAVDKGWPLPLGAVDNRRSLIYLGNLVDAMIVCLAHPGAANGTFLLSDNEDVATPELVRRLAAALHRPARLIPVPPTLLRIAGIVSGKRQAVDRLLGSLTIDGGANWSRLSWSPTISMETGLSETAAWYRINN